MFTTNRSADPMLGHSQCPLPLAMVNVPWDLSLPDRHWVCCPALRAVLVSIADQSYAPVFETELMAIDGVEKPASIKTKATGSVESKASSATEKVAEKVASKVKEAADVVKTIIADTDDTQEHNEL